MISPQYFPILKAFHAQDPIGASQQFQEAGRAKDHYPHFTSKYTKSETGDMMQSGWGLITGSVTT